MKTLGVKEQQRQKMETHRGFIAALDQSGGSTPNALRLYGIKDDAWASEDEMFAIVHQMRTRIIVSLRRPTPEGTMLVSCPKDSLQIRGC